MNYPIQVYLQYPWVFYLFAPACIVFVIVSTARLIETTGRQFNLLAAHHPISKWLVNALLIATWVYLTITLIGGAFFSGFLTLFFAHAHGVVEILYDIVIYIALTYVGFKWVKGKWYANAIMLLLVTCVSGYAIVIKPGLVCKPLAESGVTLAYRCLGHAYEYPGNEGLPVDAKLMRHWYELAADHGDAEAAYLVALKTNDATRREHLLQVAAQNGNARAAYRYALSAKETAIYFKWLNFAANKGHPDALYELGNAYYYGKGVNKDFAKTRQLWTQAAEAGSLQAMMHLASGYAADNVLFKHDPVLSEKWEKKYRQARFNLIGQNMHHEASMQEPVYDENLEISMEIWPQLLEIERNQQQEIGAGDSASMKKLAQLYLREQNADPLLRQKGLAIYRKLAKAGDLEVRYELARIFLWSGETNTAEQEEGRYWLTMAANAKYPPAVRNLIEEYENGLHGFPLDLEKAKEFNEQYSQLMRDSYGKNWRMQEQYHAYDRQKRLERKIAAAGMEATLAEVLPLAEQGDVEAQYEASCLMMKLDKRTEAIQYLEKAAANNHADAQYLMAQRIMTSVLKKTQSSLALKYYQSAVRQHHPGAMAGLGDFYRLGNVYLEMPPNLYMAGKYYQQAVASSDDDMIYNNVFYAGTVHGYVSKKVLQKYLNEIPEPIRRLHLEGLSTEQRAQQINNWYFEEITHLSSTGENKELLNMLNQQREVLLSQNKLANWD